MMNDLEKYEGLSKLRAVKKIIVCKKVLLEVPVKKPAKETWFKINKDPDYMGEYNFIELKEERGDLFFVMPDVFDQLNGIEATLVVKTIFTCINRGGDVWLWPAAVPDEDKPNKWHTSALECAELAKEKWTRMQANQSVGFYEAIVSEANSEPEWPERSFDDLLRVGFKGKIIDTMDHNVVRRLRGLE